MKRNRRAGVEDRWTRADGEPSAAHGTGKRWRARYVDDRGREHAKHFDRKTDAQRWLDGRPRRSSPGHTSLPGMRADRRGVVRRLAGRYQMHRESTVRQPGCTFAGSPKSSARCN